MRRTIQNRLFIGLLCGGTICSSVLKAQTDERGWKDIDFVRQSNAWLTSENASGLKDLSVDKISNVELFFDKENGKFVNYYQSDNLYRLGAEIESFYRLNPRIVLYGKMNYAVSEGKNMGGTAFINPDYNPFQLVELADSSSRGNKKRESYHLAGAISVAFTERLTLGGKLDYLAENFAKHRDVRHKNTLLDMLATVGLRYKFSDFLTVGVNAAYRRSVEGITFNTYVGSELPFYTLVGFGSFYGRSEVLSTSSGYAEQNSEKPMVNNFTGGDMQIALTFNENLSLFNELSYKSRSGYYGKRGNTSVTYSEHEGDVSGYKGTLLFRQAKNKHILSAQIESESLNNFEKIFKYETEQGGSTQVIYHGRSEMMKRDVLTAGIDYTAYLSIENDNPVWELTAGADYFSREQTTSIYPFFRKQDIYQYTTYVCATKNLVKNKNRYSLSLGLNYGSGGGTAKKDGVYATPSDKQETPVSMDKLLYHEFEYLTASRFGGLLGVRYSRIFENGIQGFAALNYHLTSAQELSYIEGKTAQQIEIKIGCSF
ncbi:DUF6850 family outer membrane beta-barrel protein [Massilibacteroides sp.]|uniref:DUF6850 family outer membrane beta-barrel protein n=1 Tax=Massilibacteroides sp. TaxID=2034766 RepID=UPI00263177F9|nr:DUF6850 family outer membrane beta-barrel protein [Massilibacteroides sp.]MDD4514681.1 hypothetical protein [Massilibacteroides sp.]